MTFEIPEAMVVASARRRYEETWRHDDSAAGAAFGVEDLGPWEDVEPEEQSWWLDQARADLVAALKVCTVLETWMVTGEPGRGLPSYVHGFSDRTEATDFVLKAGSHVPWRSGPNLHQRLTVDAPPAIVTEGEGDG